MILSLPLPRRRTVMDRMLVSLLNSHVEALTHRVAVLGDRASKKVILMLSESWEWAWSSKINILRRWDTRDLSFCLSLFLSLSLSLCLSVSLCLSLSHPLHLSLWTHRGKAIWGHSKKMSFHQKPNMLVGTLIMDFHAPELWENKHL